jgi:RPA family protein
MNEKVEHLFAGELNRSDLILAPSERGGQPSLLTPTGLSLRRLTLVGALTEVEGKGGDFVHARVADPTGAFTLSSGWHRPEVTGALARIEPPAFVAVTASPVLPSRGPPSRMVLRPEAVAEADRCARDTWVIATADLTLGRLEQLSAVLAGTGEDPILSRAIQHYRITPSLLLELAELISAALASVTLPAGAKAGAPQEDPKALVLAFLSARPKEAFPLETILAELARHGIGAEAGTRAVNELLAEGECYAPRKGSLRLA